MKPLRSLYDRRTISDRVLEGAVRRARKFCNLYALIKQGNFVAAGDAETLLRARGFSYADAYAHFIKPNTGIDAARWDELLYEHDLYQARLP